MRSWLARRRSPQPRLVHVARALEDGLDAAGHWLTNRPTREVVRRELKKRAKRRWRDALAAVRRLFRPR